jgi:hypothetical protein
MVVCVKNVPEIFPWLSEKWLVRGISLEGHSVHTAAD